MCLEGQGCAREASIGEQKNRAMRKGERLYIG
jgi:hypothetical protein